MDSQTRRYIKFNGYLIFVFTLIIVFYETWSLTIDTLYANQQYIVFEENILIRRNLTGRWVLAVTWVVALASYFMAMHWEDGEFLKPALLLYAVEVVLLLAQDLMRTLREDGSERFIKDAQYLFFFTVLVSYLMYTLHMLQVIFKRSNLMRKSVQYKVNLVNCTSASLAGSCVVWSDGLCLLSESCFIWRNNNNTFLEHRAEMFLFGSRRSMEIKKLRFVETYLTMHFMERDESSYGWRSL